MSLINHRLPKDVTPVNYKLFLEPDLQKFTFSGTTSISVIVNQASSSITLHSKNLAYKSFGINDARGRNVKAALSEDKGTETLTLRSEDPLTPGVYSLNFSFTGVLNDQMEGFYRSKYKVNNEVRYMATTQFESTDARQAFPCFDEPNFKATFDVTIRGPSDKTILSNCPVEAIKDDGTMKTVVFARSPVMSTYLVAFCVSDLEYIEGLTANNIKVRAYCTPGNKDKLKFSLDVAVRALEWYIKWFEIDYPLSKLDLLAVPDFSAGAMENWGLITFRESVMLCDDSTDLSEKQDIVNTICHELAHQWFGNLVTMEWWTYLWLNESMATYFGWFVSDVLFPEWHIWDKFLEQEFMTALELDSLENSHPIEVPVGKASDIQQIFDAISYSKGSCLMRFLVNYIGLDAFRSGMQKYLVTNQYRNTTSDDLWLAFGPGVKEIMKSWTQQTGYPLLCVDQEGTRLTLAQVRFFKSGPTKTSDTKWVIPVDVLLRTDNGENCVSIILDSTNRTITLPENVTSVTINPGRIGFFRVMYTRVPNIVSFRKQDKVQALSDTFSLSLSGYQEFKCLFDMMAGLNLTVETDYHIWNSIVPNLEQIYTYLQYHPNNQKNFERAVLEPTYKPLDTILRSLGWDDKPDEPINDHELRELVIRTLGEHGYEPVVKEAIARFRKGTWMAKKSVILPIVGKYGTSDDYDNLLRTYDTCDNPQIVDSLLIALANVRDPPLIKRSMDMVLSNKIREQDLWYFIKYLSVNMCTTDTIWELVTKNWDKFMAKYPAGSGSLVYLLKVMAAGFMTNKQLNEFITFFSINRPDGMDMTINQSLERITNRVAIIKRLVHDPTIKKS